MPYKQLWKEGKEKGKGEKETCTRLNTESQRIARRDKKSLLQCAKKQENNRIERLEIYSRKLEVPREHFMQRWAQ